MNELSDADADEASGVEKLALFGIAESCDDCGDDDGSAEGYFSIWMDCECGADSASPTLVWLELREDDIHVGVREDDSTAVTEVASIVGVDVQREDCVQCVVLDTLGKHSKRSH